MYCIVKHCGTTWKPKSDVKFHNVPKDERRRQHWLSIVPIKGKISQRSTICGLHFKPEDYNPERPGRLLSSAHPYYIPQPCDCFDTKACTTVRSTQTISQQDLRLLKTRESEKNDGHTHIKEEPGLSLEESCVKSEPGEYGEQVIKTEPLSELDADHVIEIEPYTEHVVKTEPLSELYSDHVVKDELVLGPERPHRPLPGLVHELSDWLALEGAHAAASVKHEPAQRATNTETIIYACDLCGHLFKLKQKLIRHIKDHSKTHARTQSDNSDKPYSCEVCKKKFKRSSHLSEHMRIHTGENLYSCKICEKKFTTRSNLITHERIHTGDKPYTCEICEKKFTALWNLTVHKRIHTGDKPFSCDICEKKFIDSSKLTMHKRIHTGDKPYSCEICERKFMRLRKLVEHKRIHSGDTPYVCKLCEKKFTTASILKSHIRTHAREKPFSCEVCTKKFSQWSSLKRHIQNEVCKTGV